MTVGVSTEKLNTFPMRWPHMLPLGSRGRLLLSDLWMYEGVA